MTEDTSQEDQGTVVSLRQIAAILLVILGLSLSSCTSSSNLKSYVDTTDGYAFQYPNGWLPTKVSSGAEVVFRDLIEQTENVSVVISDVPENAALSDLGTPTEVGQRLAQQVLAPPESGRDVELISVDREQENGKEYYILEYAVKLAEGQERHNLANVVVNRGRLYTFNASTTEARWPSVESLFEEVVHSFSVS